MALFRINNLGVFDMKICSAVKHNVEVLSIFQTFIRRKFSSSANDPQMPKPKTEKISTAMKLYLENAKKYDEFLQSEKYAFEKGKRHLANMMGMDYEQMTQKDIDNSIRYLFPSGLYEKSARPLMKPSDVIYPPRKAAQFDWAGRPFHSMFYTVKQNYHQLLFNIVEEIEKLNDIEHNLALQGNTPGAADKFDKAGSEWENKTTFEKSFYESIKDNEYDYLIATLNRLIDHRCSGHATEFIMQHRKFLLSLSKTASLQPIQIDENGREFVHVPNLMSKSCRGTLTLWANGSGKFIINGHDGIDYFDLFQSREQVLFPFVFINKISEFDVEANVNLGGPIAQAGAIRWGIAWALRSFVDEQTIERMRLAGLLTKDIRRKERKKPGQEGARRKFTWKKR